MTYLNQDEPLQIKSVIVKEGLKGKIYIEAYKQAHVSKAIENIAAINQFQITMVPIAEMVDTLKVVKNIPTLKPGAYVRLVKTQYKGDLARVDSVDVASNRVYLILVPRIDYTKMRGGMRDKDGPPQNKSKRIPAPRLFDVEKIKKIGGDVTQDGDFYIFEGNRYRRGFLYKAFNLNAIQTDGVKPSLTELEMFQESVDDLKKELETATIRDKTHNFAPGDNIEVIEGELVNLRGKVLSIDGDKVVIRPDHEDLKVFSFYT